MFEQQQQLFGTVRPLSWRDRYNIVIRSKRWALLRDKFIYRCDSRCMRCNWQKTQWSKGRTLELHHRTYERLGAEAEGDLELLCSVCHARADEERAAEGRRRADAALYDARFDGWARACFGDDYWGIEDEWMHDQFEDWLERKYDDGY